VARAVATTGACRSCGAALPPDGQVCPHCGASRRKAGGRGLVGLALILGGVGIGGTGLYFQALGVVYGVFAFGKDMLNLCTCSSSTNPPGSGGARETALGFALLQIGVELLAAGIILNVVRVAARTGPAFLRKAAIASCVFAVIGLGCWIPALFGAGPGALSWQHGTGEWILWLHSALAVALVLASLVQVAAAAGFLKERGWAPEALRKVTWSKLGLYFALWLLLPAATSSAIGAAPFRVEYWVAAMVVAGGYFWLAQALGTAADGGALAGEAA
jgi:hypothetical protein